MAFTASNLIVANNATSTLAGSITTSATTVALHSGDGAKFSALGSSGDYWCPVTVVDSNNHTEVMYATAVSGDTLTVVRGQEGTTAYGFAAGASIGLRLSAGAIDAIQTGLADSAPLESPVLTGSPTAPTPEHADDSANIATTAFVNDALENGVGSVGSTQYSGVPSGVVVFTLAQSATAGWLMFNDGTVGNASSNASYANENAQTVFNMLYAFSDSNAPLSTSGGSATTRSAQGSAATAWAANCRVCLPRVLGRTLAAAGSGYGLTTRNLGDFVGEENHELSQAELPSVSFDISGIELDNGAVTGTVFGATSTGGYVNGLVQGTKVSTNNTSQYGLDLTSNVSVSQQGAAASGGQNSPHNNIQPTTFLNAMVKL